MANIINGKNKVLRFFPINENRRKKPSSVVNQIKLKNVVLLLTVILKYFV